MTTQETLNEGLRRAYRLSISAADIDARIDAEVRQVAPGIRMPGFRPGKVPANLVRKMHGPALAQDALNKAIDQGVRDLVNEHKLRPAVQPSVALADGYAPGKDAEVTVELEVLPVIENVSIEGLTLERLTVEADEAAVDTAMQGIAGQMKRFADAPEGTAAAMGDQLVIDFDGSIDGVPFEGGKGEDMAVELGSGQLIPGFEDQLVGAKVGDAREVAVSFPENYGAEHLAGKAARFAVTVKAVKNPADQTLDDDFAKQLGLDGMDQLRGMMKDNVEQELNGLTRTHMKRRLLDQLAASHDFDVPPSMVEAEFKQIWRQLETEAGREEDPAAAMAALEGDRDEYHAIAVRRVRLGLLLSEIGQKNGIEVSQQEMQRLMMQAAQQYRPEDRERFVQYVQQDPLAAAQLRAPLYEDKVVDFLFTKATITDRPVTRDELEAAIEAEDDGAPAGDADADGHVHGPDCDHDHDHDHGHGHGHGDAGDAGDGAAAASPSEGAAKPARKPRKPKEAKDAAPAATDAVPEGGEGEAPKAAKPRKAKTKPAADSDAAS